jgi:hypothetical protein
MTASVLGVTRGLIEAWVRFYTLGLEPRHRRERIEQVESDVFEQVADGESLSAVALAFSLFSRCLRGAADDLTWRLFDAPRLPHETMPSLPEGRPTMVSRTPGVAFFAVTAGVIWAGVLVLAVQPVPGSLAYAGGLLALVALAGWALEARGSAEDESSSSAWPLLLALAIVTIAGGIVFGGERLGLLRRWRSA